MTRGRTTAQKAADTAGHAGVAILVEAIFDSGTLRLIIGPWPQIVGGNTYTPTGGLLRVSNHDEAVDGIEGKDFEMDGLNAAIFQLVVSEPYHNRVVRLLEQRFDANDVAVGDPTVEYIGRITAMGSTEDPESRTHTVTVQTEQYDALFTRPREIRFSDTDQKRRYAGDKMFEYVASLVDRIVTRKPKV